MTDFFAYSWPGGRSLAALAAALSTRGPLRRLGRRTLERTYLDTFDGRLYRAGWTLTLCEEPVGRFLEGREPGGGLRCRAAAKAEPRFAADLPEGGLAEELADRIAPRRLLSQAIVEVRATRFRCLDRRDKTIARVQVERRRVRFPDRSDPRRTLAARVTIEALRGFEDAAADLAAACGELGLVPIEADELAEALALVDRRPGQDPARLALALDSRGSAGDALAMIHQALLSVVRATEDGVRRELDPEFLHDYRVALRRTRSTLGQLTGVYAEEPTERFRHELGRLARETGPLRDLDVFAAELADERAGDPELAGPLEPLVELVQRQRRRTGRRLTALLDGSRAERTLGEWQDFLAAPDWGPSAALPARAVFGEALLRCHGKLLRRGSKLGDGSPPEDFHRLRIDAKKLRYVLETGASLFDAEAVAARLEPLKALQELLGLAQDLAVREARLADAATELAATAPPATLLAAGRLVERAHHRRLDLYREFPRIFGAFAAPAEQKRWPRLLRASR